MTQDIDNRETREWVEALEEVIERDGPDRAHFLIEALVDKARRSGAYLPYNATTAYANTIPPHQEAHRPGDPALGPAVEKLAGRHHAVLLANHGPVVAGTSLENAVFATEELEETAKLFLLLRRERIKPLTPEQVAELRAHFPS